MKRTLIQIILVLIVAFVVYFPTIQGELITGDDGDLFKRLERVEQWQPERLFFRSASKLLYYRPLVIFSYHFDKLVWNLNTVFMHVENIVLHAICAVLVFFLARFLIPISHRNISFLPLVAALLFAVHPLTSESTSWISGRTDLVAGVFVLLSALCLMKYRERRSVLMLTAGLLFFVLATFSKEVAVAFLPGALALFFSKQPQCDLSSVLKEKKRGVGLWISLWIVAAFLVFFVVRFAAHGSSGKIGLTLSVIFNDLWYATFTCLRGIGFYFKKLFFPWPLNFAILEIDPLYELLGLPVVAFVLYLLFRRRLGGAFVVAGAFLVTPSFLLMFNQIAWTPYAERYLYIPLAFFIPPVVVWVGHSTILSIRTMAHFGAAILIVSLFFSTFDRSLVWSTNLSLWGDTMKKSPYSLAAKNDYAIALYNRERVKESILFFREASRSSSGVCYNPRYGVNLGNALMDDGQFTESKKAFMEVLTITKCGNHSAMNGLEELFNRLVKSTNSIEERENLGLELDEIKLFCQEKEKI